MSPASWSEPRLKSYVILCLDEVKLGRLATENNWFLKVNAGQASSNHSIMKIMLTMRSLNL